MHCLRRPCRGPRRWQPDSARRALSVRWDFGIGSATGPGPHVIAYPNAGTFTVRLTVADGALSDPTPATRRVTVTDNSGCIDADGDGWYTGGTGCAPIDCDDGDPTVSPGAIEACTDGIDNDCNGLIDGADPGAVGCAGCLDSDGDRFSPEGGRCGPVDCDDTDPAVSPGAIEACADGIDNDCDDYLDDTDPDCAGDDCHDRLRRGPGLGVLVTWTGEPGAAEPLDGLAVSGPLQVFIADRDGIAFVQWRIDGRLIATDDNAPWTLTGSDDDDDGPDLFDTRSLANGWHGVTAEITLDDGSSQRFTAAMFVDNAAANQPPGCSIVAPAGPVRIASGERVRFAGSGNDPDGDLPLRFRWDFDGAAPEATVEVPGAIALRGRGERTVTFTVIDAAGLACTPPATVRVRFEDDDDKDDKDDEDDEDDEDDKDGDDGRDDKDGDDGDDGKDGKDDDQERGDHDQDRKDDERKNRDQDRKGRDQERGDRDQARKDDNQERGGRDEDRKNDDQDRKDDDKARAERDRDRDRERDEDSRSPDRERND